MPYRIIDRPSFIEALDYYTRIDHVVAYLSESNSVKSIHRLGNITDPGISDIDMLVVFKDGHGLTEDPRKVLDETGRYLFTHQLFGINESALKDAMDFSLYHNFEHLWGEDCPQLSEVHRRDTRVMKQIAIEYLVKLFISQTVQKESKILKLRAFLLEVKAVKFDLDILSKVDSEIGKTVENIIAYRSTWFEKPMTDSEIIIVFETFYDQLKKLLLELSETYNLYVERKQKINVAKNLSLVDGKTFAFKANKCVPRAFNRFVPHTFLPKYFKLLNRLNTYEFTYPMIEFMQGDVIAKKNAYEKKLIQYLNDNSPGFIAMKSPLRLHH
jgi:hypothetical protein